MIFKQIDNRNKEITTLKDLLQQSNSEAQKKMISQTLKTLENGYKAEKENAYYLDFVLEDRKRSFLLHDIRLEHNGKTAQFDHILITGLGVILLESKSFTGKLTINNDNSLTVKYSTATKTFPNPVEQNNRHKIVLNSFLKDHIDLSARFKLMGGIQIEGTVLIHPSTTVTNKNLPKGFERSDSFVAKREQELDSMNVGKVFLGAVTLLTLDNMKEIAQLLVAHHKPITFDYRKKFKVSKLSKEEPAKAVQKKEKVEENTIHTSNKILKCPRCENGTLVKRKRKSKKYGDKYQSNEFLGCSSFPKCKYTQEI